MQETAEICIYKWRKLKLNLTDPSDPSHFIFGVLKDSEAKFKGNYDLHILENWLDHKFPVGSAGDKKFQQIFLEKNIEGRLPDLEDLDLKSYLPGRSALIYYLLSDINNNLASWQFPTAKFVETMIDNSSADLNSLEEGIEVKEITLGESSESQLNLFRQWVERNLSEGKKDFPFEFLPFTVQYFNISSEAYNAIVETNSKKQYHPGKYTCSMPQPGITDVRKIPARIIIGNGLTWLGSIRFPFYMSEKHKGEYDLWVTQISDNSLKFLTNLPPLVGLEVMEDRRFVQQTMLDLFGVKVILPHCIEISSIAVALGWDLHCKDLFSMNLITLGSLVNKRVGFADGMWPQPFDELWTGYQLQCLAEIRFMNSGFIVLSSLLLRNIFPDPDVFCSTLEINQEDAIIWFCSMMSKCIGETRLGASGTNMVKNRKTMIKTLHHVKDLPDGTWIMDREPDSRILAFAELIPEWANPTYGGALHLQTVRARFVFQLRCMKSMGITLTCLEPHLNRRDINPELIKTITFNRGILISSTSKGENKHGLRNHPDFDGKVFKLEGTDLSNDQLLDLCKKTGQTKVFGILEWARLNHWNIANLLRSLSCMNMATYPRPFWIEKTFVYERLRLMHYYLYNTHAPTVPSIMAEIDQKHARVVQQEENARDRQLRILSNRDKRISLINVQTQRNQMHPRPKTGAHQLMYNKVPGDNIDRNRKWRERAQRKQENLKRLGNYIPKKEWKAMKKAGINPETRRLSTDLQEHEVVVMADEN